MTYEERRRECHKVAEQLEKLLRQGRSLTFRKVHTILPLKPEREEWTPVSASPLKVRVRWFKGEDLVFDDVRAVDCRDIRAYLLNDWQYEVK